MKKNILGNVQELVIVIVTFLVIGIMLFPFFWMVVSSVKPPDELLSRNIRFVSGQFTWRNYKGIFEAGFLRFILNSILVCSISTSLCVYLIALQAAYSISRYKFPGKSLIVAIMGFTQMFPWIILVTTVFMFLCILHLVNS